MLVKTWWLSNITNLFLSAEGFIKDKCRHYHIIGFSYIFFSPPREA